MNKTFTLLMLLACFIYKAKAQSPDKIIFTYDDAGNQVKRELCINCPTGTGKIAKDAKTLTKDDLLKSDVSDQISYYPNPVKQELYLRWEFFKETKVTSIQLYSLDGKLLKSFQNTDKINEQTILFQPYPRGVYSIVLLYNNGEKKSIKIIKQ